VGSTTPGTAYRIPRIKRTGDGAPLSAGGNADAGPTRSGTASAGATPAPLFATTRPTIHASPVRPGLSSAGAGPSDSKGVGKDAVEEVEDHVEDDDDDDPVRGASTATSCSGTVPFPNARKLTSFVASPFPPPLHEPERQKRTCQQNAKEDLGLQTRAGRAEAAARRG
jgi:hypothetical protein